VGTAHMRYELLWLAPVQALTFAQGSLAQAFAPPGDRLQQGLARLLCSFAFERRMAGRGKPSLKQCEVVLLAEMFSQLTGAAGECAQAEHLGGVAQVLHAFAPFMQRACAPLTAGRVQVAPAPLPVELEQVALDYGDGGPIGQASQRGTRAQLGELTEHLGARGLRTGRPLRRRLAFGDEHLAQLDQ
jgi:hypothetical protein